MVKRRRSYETGHRPKFLAVVDGSEECAKAIRFAARRCARVGASIVLLGVATPPEHETWLGVGEVMLAEAQAEAEKRLETAAAAVRTLAAVSYTHLDVYKRQGSFRRGRDDRRRLCRGPHRRPRQECRPEPVHSLMEKPAASAPESSRLDVYKRQGLQRDTGLDIGTVVQIVGLVQAIDADDRRQDGAGGDNGQHGEDFQADGFHEWRPEAGPPQRKPF